MSENGNVVQVQVMHQIRNDLLDPIPLYTTLFKTAHKLHSVLQRSLKNRVIYGTILLVDCCKNRGDMTVLGTFEIIKQDLY